MKRPLVSIICLCFNHERFLVEALHSALNQTYSPIELIIVDDKSTDRSVEVIEGFVRAHPEVIFIGLTENVGNCAAFNIGLAKARGSYVVDFATDDVFLPNRIEAQVQFFETLPPDYGVVFTDAVYIDEEGKNLRQHYPYLKAKRLLNEVPTGNVYKDVVSKYFICGPTMLVKRDVFEKLNGYDETLAYEDFDFWVRASRYFRFGFLNKVLTKVRKSANSKSKGWYVPGNPMLLSTYKVCLKAKDLNRNDDENAALLERLRFEFRQSVMSGNHAEADLFFKLIGELGKTGILDNTLQVLNSWKVPLSGLLKLYHRLRYT